MTPSPCRRPHAAKDRDSAARGAFLPPTPTKHPSLSSHRGSLRAPLFCIHAARFSALFCIHLRTPSEPFRTPKPTANVPHRGHFAKPPTSHPSSGRATSGPRLNSHFRVAAPRLMGESVCDTVVPLFPATRGSSAGRRRFEKRRKPTTRTLPRARGPAGQQPLWPVTGAICMGVRALQLQPRQTVRGRTRESQHGDFSSQTTREEWPLTASTGLGTAAVT